MERWLFNGVVYFIDESTNSITLVQRNNFSGETIYDIDHIKEYGKNLNKESTKQVIVVREDLGMSIGKTAAQVAHASLMSFLDTPLEIQRTWINESFKKVVLKVEDLKELMNIYDKTKKMKISNCLIIDAGRTELEPNTITCLGIGPDENKLFKKLTDDLELL